MAAHSANDILFIYISIFVSHHDFWSGNYFLIEPFPDNWLLSPFCYFTDSVHEIGINVVENIKLKS